MILLAKAVVISPVAAGRSVSVAEQRANPVRKVFGKGEITIIIIITTISVTNHFTVTIVLYYIYHQGARYSEREKWSQH